MACQYVSQWYEWVRRPSAQAGQFNADLIRTSNDYATGVRPSAKAELFKILSWSGTVQLHRALNYAQAIEFAGYAAGDEPARLLLELSLDEALSNVLSNVPLTAPIKCSIECSFDSSIECSIE